MPMVPDKHQHQTKPNQTKPNSEFEAISIHPSIHPLRPRNPLPTTQRLQAIVAIQQTTTNDPSAANAPPPRSLRQIVIFTSRSQINSEVEHPVRGSIMSTSETLQRVPAKQSPLRNPAQGPLCRERKRQRVRHPMVLPQARVPSMLKSMVCPTADG